MYICNSAYIISDTTNTITIRTHPSHTMAGGCVRYTGARMSVNVWLHHHVSCKRATECFCGSREVDTDSPSAPYPFPSPHFWLLSMDCRPEQDHSSLTAGAQCRDGEAARRDRGIWRSVRARSTPAQGPPDTDRRCFISGR